MSRGILYIISAPSGTGKSSLISKVLLETKIFRNTRVSVSYTTRNIRPGEKNGKHYFFISKKKFFELVKQNIFIEYAEIFGNYYGTSRLDIENILKVGLDVFLNINWQGARQIRQKNMNFRSIFILPPSKAELIRRLKNRGLDSEIDINKRITQAAREANHCFEYDFIIINDDFNLAISSLKSIIYAENLRKERQQFLCKKIVKELTLD